MSKQTKHKLVPKLRFSEFRSEWTEMRLEELISNFIVPMRDKPKDLNGNIPWCRIEDFDGMYISKSKSNQGVSLTTVKKMNLKVYPKGTLLVSCSADLGRCAITLTELVTNQTFIGLVPQKDNPNVVFLYYAMIKSQDRLNAQSSGTTISYLSREKFEKFPIIIPDIKEQKKIADCLTSLDDLITAENQKLDALKDHKSGLMQQLFPAEGKTLPELRFKEFKYTEDWVEKSLNQVCKTFSGGTPSTTKSEFYGGDIPFIRSAEIGKETTELFLTVEGLNNSSAKLIDKGDVLVALYGANSGDVALAKIDGAINQAILCLKSEGSNPFIYHFLTFKKSWIVSTYLQGGQGNLSGDIIKSIKLLFPNPKEQQKIAECLSSLDELIVAQTEKIELLKEHKKGLMQGLFPVIQ